MGYGVALFGAVATGDPGREVDNGYGGMVSVKCKIYGERVHIYSGGVGVFILVILIFLLLCI